MADLLNVIRERPHHRPDYFLGLIILALIAVGVIIIYSTGSIVNFNITGGASDRNVFFTNQLLSLTIGLGAWWFTSRFPYRNWQKYSLWMLIASFVLMALVVVPGISSPVNGASRWIRLGPASFQPAEFLKLSLVLYLATWAEQHRASLRDITKGLPWVMLVLIISAVLAIILQRDMGTGMVILLAGLTVFFLSDVSLWFFGIGLTSIAAGASLMLVAFPYRLARLSTFFNRHDDLTGADYHINQAIIALGSGGILGRGLGNSLQSYGFLPESTNDSIFAILGEQFGLWGTSAVVGLFALFAWRGMRIARLAPDRFGRMVAGGLTVWILAQAVINISAMLSIIPLTGIPLPFISYGGTSLLATMTAIGILQNISRYTEREAEHADNRSGRRDRRSRHTNVSPLRGAPSPR